MTHKHKPLTIQTDFGKVAIDDAAKEAITKIQDMAWTLQLTPAEFISEFDHGIPECPECKKGKH